MKNAKIGKKLAICFISIGVLLLLVCGVAFYGIIMGNNRIRVLYNQNLIAMNDVGQMSEIFQEERALTRDLIMYTHDTNTYKASLSQLQTSNQNMMDYFSKYESTIKQTENRDLFNKVKTLYTGDFAEYKNELQELTDQDMTLAAKEKMASAITIVNTMADDLVQLAALNDKYASQALQTSQVQMNILLGFCIAVVLITAVCIILILQYLRKNIALKISEVAVAAKQIAAGNTDIMLAVNSRDEVGELADAFNGMVAGIQEQAAVIIRLSDGDASIDYVPRSEKDTMGKALVKTIAGLNSIFSNIRTSVYQINSGAEQVAGSAEVLSQGASEQASSVEELSATIMEISNDVQRNAKNAGIAKELADKAELEVEKGSRQMDSMITAMGDISNSSAEISNIIKVIEDIAFQTNILALNAAVEAARAGAAGKGFAVVADEVRNLAAKSADAAKTTTELIQRSISKTKEGTKIADVTAHSLNEIIESVSQVLKLIEKIDAASAEQAVAIEQVTQGIDQISAVVQTNSATAEESAAASEELSSQANLLQKVLSELKLKD